MSFLRLNGIIVPVSITGASEGNEVVGASARTPDASLVVHRQAIKEMWQFTSPPLPYVTAQAIKNLVRGLGQYWSFDVSVYSTKGLPFSPVPIFSVLPKFGAQAADLNSVAALVAAGAFAVGSAWTVSYWLNKTTDDNVYHHRAVTSAGAKYLDGVRNDALSTPELDVTNGTITFDGQLTGDDCLLDDVVACPYLWPDDWAAEVYVFNSAFGSLPLLNADGNFIRGGTQVVSVAGEVRAVKQIATGAGAYQALDVLLTEK